MAFGERRDRRVLRPRSATRAGPHGEYLLATLTVALLGVWTARLTGRWSLALLVPLVYASSPEVFVRSGYGGHFATENFAALMVLMAVGQWEMAGGMVKADAACFLAGLLAAIANQKLLFLPLAIVVWEIMRERACSGDRGPTRRDRAHRAGCTAPCSTPWYSASPAERSSSGSGACGSHRPSSGRTTCQTHIINRILSDTAEMNQDSYPSIAELWRELWQYTGHLLLPMGPPRTGVGRSPPPPANGRLMAIWTLIAAAAFSLVDWRQTKHLMPLLIPLCLAPACWASTSRGPRGGCRRGVCGVLAWNLYTVYGLRLDFAAFVHSRLVAECSRHAHVP